MNAFDYSILSFFNQFLNRYPLFDKGVVFLSENGFIRGGVVSALLWWAWFSPGAAAKEGRARAWIVTTLLAAPISICIARFIAATLPFRVRPISDPSLGLHFPAAEVNWIEWSSFPSDHAILFFTVTTSLFFISRPLGWIALLDTVFVVCLPRIYLGIHYPTDVLAGAAIGVAIAYASNRTAFSSFVGKWVAKWIDVHPSSFYACFFVITYEISALFWDIRALSTVASYAIAKAIGGSVSAH